MSNAIVRTEVRHIIRRTGWTPARRRTFLDHLAENLNVRAAAGAAGMTHAGLYRLRRRDAEFAEAWDDALEAGYDRVEARLLATALNQDADPPVNRVDVELLKWLLTRHRAPNTKTRRTLGPSPTRATAEETNAAILKHLAALEKRRARGGV